MVKELVLRDICPTHTCHRFVYGVCSCGKVAAASVWGDALQTLLNALLWEQGSEDVGYDAETSPKEGWEIALFHAEWLGHKELIKFCKKQLERLA